MYLIPMEIGPFLGHFPQSRCVICVLILIGSERLHAFFVPFLHSSY